MTQLTGAIIAGGSASRLAGRPKGLELVDGTRIIDRVAAALRPHCDRLLVAPGTLDATRWLPNAAVAPDVLPVRASIAGIHAAILAAPTNVVAIAWDMPFVPAALVGELIRRLGKGAWAVVPVVGGRPEPLCAAYAKRAGDSIAALVHAGSLKNSDVLARLPNVVWLEEADLRHFGDPTVMFFNVNTAADLARAEEIAHSM
jgi:molybdopterin-guanine dinucleotide biosynthesis protein A